MGNATMGSNSRENAIYTSRTVLSQMLEFNVFGNFFIKFESEEFL